MKKIVLSLLFTGCSFVAQSIDHEANNKFLGSLNPWEGYYAMEGKNRFDFLRTSIKIENQYIYEQNFLIGLESGQSTIVGAQVYAIEDKTVVYASTNVKKGNPSHKQKTDTETITNRLQLSLNNSLDIKDKSLRVFDMMKITKIDTKFTNTGKFLPLWDPMETNTNIVFKMRPPKIMLEEQIPQDIANQVPWEVMAYDDIPHPLPTYPPMKLDPDTDTRPFLEKITDGEKSAVYVLSPIAEKNAKGMLSLIGMGAGTEITLFKECAKNPDGTPYMHDPGKGYPPQKVFGYSGKYPLFYTPIDDLGNGQAKNRFGIYWFFGDPKLFLEGKLQIPLYIWDGRLFSGYLKFPNQEVKPKDYIFLTEIPSADELFRLHFLAHKIK